MLLLCRSVGLARRRAEHVQETMLPDSRTTLLQAVQRELAGLYTRLESMTRLDGPCDQRFCCPYQQLDMRNLEDENGGSWAHTVLKCGAS